MKRRFLWLVALAGVIWLYLRRGARRPEPVEHVPPAAAAADPAEELRRKLEETKERGEDATGSHLAEPEPPRADPAPAQLGQPSVPVVSDELDARRREVHERARSAAEDMRGKSSD